GKAAIFDRWGFQMTRTLSAVALGLLAISFSGPSNAADLAPRPVYKAPVYSPIAPVFSWQGFYAGFNGGYGFGNSTLSGAGASSSIEPKGALLGSTLGYNFQADTIVYGIEGDVDYSWMNETADAAPCSGCEVHNHYLATARG